jgi:subfamily B ATP-binding cassette protein HlyB/CyaB
MQSPDIGGAEAIKAMVDSGLIALCGVAAFFRIPSNPGQLARELALGSRFAEPEDIVRAAKLLGLQGRWQPRTAGEGIHSLPVPSILRMKTGAFVVFGGKVGEGRWRLVDPVTRADSFHTDEELAEVLVPGAVLIRRRFLGKGTTADNFSFMWFLPSIWRYRRPLAHVIFASMITQMFALVSPLFFQVIIDKVLVHHSVSTLNVMVVGLVLIILFDTVLQYLRTYALNHTTNRIDVELGQRLFAHLLRLPISYFETRPTGQTVARVRELETIRSFLTGQGLSSILDLLFTIIFIAVLFYYSVTLTLVVLASLPIYILIAMLIRPGLQERIMEKFNRGAASQQFLVESVVGIQTIKASAVEPAMRNEWDDRLAAYVRTSFDANRLGALGHGAIQAVSRISTAMVLFFGAHAVMDGALTVGALVAFNMIAGQVSQPVLRLSQLWQDFQQVKISISRLGDILNSPPEPAIRAAAALPPPRGAIEFKNVSFRYSSNGPDVLRNVSFAIRPGEVIGLVGASGSGKSSIAKLIQRFFVPQEGQVLLDGADLSQVDPAWLRSHIGVVLQENLLFNRTIHENIAFADPAMPRTRVIAAARLAGADEFISRLPSGYDTQIEERGANLSGGQRQRIAIARALVTNPRLLIFDEATSALDYESEQIIQDNMRSIVQGRTVIIIAHRLGTVRDCSRIFALQEGRIVESGTHDSLLIKPNGLYAKLWSMQFGKELS